MTKINFKTIAPYSDCDLLLFIKPLLCKTVRVFNVPEGYRKEGMYDEIMDVLNATATLKREGVWYYTPADEDMLHSAMQHLTDILQIEYFLMQELPKYGRDDENNPIAEILN